jgi:hypothetical protein
LITGSGVTGFKIQPELVLHRAIDRGIVPPTARRIAAASELAPGTVARALRGELVSAATLAALTDLLGDGLAILVADDHDRGEILPFWRKSFICATGC